MEEGHTAEVCVESPRGKEIGKTDGLMLESAGHGCAKSPKDEGYRKNRCWWTEEV